MSVAKRKPKAKMKPAKKRRPVKPLPGEDDPVSLHPMKFTDAVAALFPSPRKGPGAPQS